jgi:pimeloyl-ACP methyl ester carboxylesterase
MTDFPHVDGVEHRFVEAAGLRMHVAEAGDGPPLLLLHGWPQHWYQWRGVMARIRGERRLIAPDLRGFGWTDAPGRGYNGETFGADAIALLDALGIERAHLIGHDWGGFAVFAAALAAPQRVDRMVVLNTVPPWVNTSLRAVPELWRTWYVFALAAFGERMMRRPELLARGMRRDLVHEDRLTEEDALVYASRLSTPEGAYATTHLYRSYVRSFREVIVRRRYADLRLTVPTHFLFGANDGAISPRLLEGVEDHCDDLTLELVEDSGHFIAEERPDLVAQRARELFERA